MQRKLLELLRCREHMQFRRKIGMVPTRGVMKMAKAQEFTTVMKDMFGAFPIDMSAFQDAIKSQAAFGEKLSKVALTAASKSAEISTKWTKDAIARAGDVARVKEDPADYGQAVSDYASAQSELVSEHLAAFADIAKKVQLDTVELVMAAGKDVNEDATAAVEKATADATSAAKKAAGSAK